MIIAAFGSNTRPDTVARVPCAATRPQTPVMDAIAHKTRHTNFVLVMKRRTSLFGLQIPLCFLYISAAGAGWTNIDRLLFPEHSDAIPGSLQFYHPTQSFSQQLK